MIRIGVTGITSVLAAVCIGGTPVGPPSLRHLDIELVADPTHETLHVSIEMQIDLTGSPKTRKSGEYWFQFTEPAVISQFADKSTGEPIAYEFSPIPGTPSTYGIKRLMVRLPHNRDRVVVLAKYTYTRETLTGFFLNPTTDDNLHFGQVRRDAMFASHLRYYPTPIGTPGSPPFETASDASATVNLIVPVGWKGVTAGNLVDERTSGGLTTFSYNIERSSGRLPYPFAIFPYQEISEGKVSVYFAERDRSYAVEKLHLINSKIIPFLTGLMGPPPFSRLRLIEVFPFEGNTGLAAKDVVMLSERIWFATSIGENLTSNAAVVLVDEIAHQWNYYKVQLPNYLAEGVSEYIDALFTEHVRDAREIEARIGKHRREYARSVAILNQMKRLKEQSLAKAEIAKRLNLSDVELAAYWPYADAGEVPISDPAVFPKLYFLKGAAALHSLRRMLGDSTFFRGFRSVFAGDSATPGEVSLDRFRSSFEVSSGRNLEGFFRLWYREPGLPD